MYVLRIEIELDDRDAIDDIAARALAAEQFAEMNLGKLAEPSKGVKVKLQKRVPNQAPRAVRVI